LLATVPFSLIHVVAMVGIRKLVYAAAGSEYEYGHWPREFLYEYLKDVRTYAFLLGIVYLYRFILLRLQGEARLLTAPEAGPAVETVERPERFLVRKVGAEFLVPARDIEWLEAAENYVNLHVRGRVYPLRSTMTAIQDRLDPQRFIRVHRSYIVNLDFLVQIEPTDAGDAQLILKDGARVPCSRRYRQSLKGDRLAAAAAE
jgi:DNA-binding LytR/AlgR family response regulator